MGGRGCESRGRGHNRSAWRVKCSRSPPGAGSASTTSPVNARGSPRGVAGGDGLLHVFVPHAMAGVALMESARGATRICWPSWRAAPADDRWQHAHGSRGHGRSHVLPAFVAPFRCFPCSAGGGGLGTWQSVALVDLNVDNPDRQVRVSYLGVAAPGGGRLRVGSILHSGGLGTCAAGRPSVDCAGKKCRRGQRAAPAASGREAGAGARWTAPEERVRGGIVSATARQARINRAWPSDSASSRVRWCRRSATQTTATSAAGSRRRSEGRRACR